MIRSYWYRLTRRERILAGLTAALLVAFGGGVVVYAALTSLDELDTDISRLEQDLINLQIQAAQGQGIEAAYREVVDEHSTHLTEQEIHDNLRREIYRLALKQPPAKDSEQTVENLKQSDYLVWIPELREGTMRAQGEGFREYQIRIRIPMTNILALRVFLTRLQRSSQLLRIDSLEFSRPPNAMALSVSMEVTRTVLDRPEGDQARETRRGLDNNGSARTAGRGGDDRIARGDSWRRTRG